MIDYLQGTVRQILPDRLILMVGGVGYGVEVPLPILSQNLTANQNLELWIYTHVREDQIRLFGFESLADKQVFLILLAISGIGPRIALAILSTIPVSTLMQIVVDQRVDQLKRVPGIGQRTAEKMLVELKGKLDHLWLQGAISGGENPLFLTKSHNTSQILHDVESALCNLGFKTADFQQTLKDMAAKMEKPDFQDLLRKVLSALNQRSKPQAHKANLDAVF